MNIITRRNKWEERTLKKYEDEEPKYCPRCGRKLWKKEVGAYIGDEGFNSCKEKIYYSVDCRRCKIYSKVDGSTV